jgi:hypothetical protein
MRLGLEDVAQRLELCGIAAAAVGERLTEEPVGQPRVPRQERPVQVRPDRASDPAALEAALAIIAEPGDDPP